MKTNPFAGLFYFAGSSTDPLYQFSNPQLAQIPHLSLYSLSPQDALTVNVIQGAHWSTVVERAVYPGCVLLFTSNRHSEHAYTQHVIPPASPPSLQDRYPSPDPLSAMYPTLEFAALEFEGEGVCFREVGVRRGDDVRVEKFRELVEGRIHGLLVFESGWEEEDEVGDLESEE